MRDLDIPLNTNLRLVRGNNQESSEIKYKLVFQMPGLVSYNSATFSIVCPVKV